MINISPIKSTTQSHLLIADIADDLVLTKEGGAALILKASAVNFSLLSEREQEAITYAYAAFLNSLSFPIQIVVRSQKKDVTSYLKYLGEAAQNQTNEKLKKLIDSYQNFVSQIVKKRNVLEKEFFICLPFSPYELGLSAAGAINQILGKKKKVPFERDYILKKAKTSLYPKRDHIIRQSGRLGIKVVQLTDQEIARLFWKIYHDEKGEQNGQH